MSTLIIPLVVNAVGKTFPFVIVELPAEASSVGASVWILMSSKCTALQ
jgi:hypothetical protein